MTTVCRGVKKCYRIFAKQFIKKIKNWQCTEGFLDILQLPHTVILNSEKLTHPTVQCMYISSVLCRAGHVPIFLLRDNNNATTGDNLMELE